MIKAFCRTCGGDRNHEILNSKKINGSEFDYFFWMEDYQIIKCLGCDTISFRHVYGDSEMIGYDENQDIEYLEEVKIYPQYLKSGKELENIYSLPLKIRDIYLETVIALKNNLFLLASGGLRACIEAICIDKDITDFSLMDKIDKLSDKGFLTKNDSKHLHSIRFLGNNALHEIDKPDEKSIFILFDIVNHTLENLYLKEVKMKESKYQMIDTIDDFIKVLSNNIKKEQIESIIDIDIILGKSKNLIKNGLSKKILVEELITKIKSSEIDFIDHIDNNNFKVIKVPEIKFNFDDLDDLPF